MGFDWVGTEEWMEEKLALLPRLSGQEKFIVPGIFSCLVVLYMVLLAYGN